MKKRLAFATCLLTLTLGLLVSARAAETPTAKQQKQIAQLTVMGQDVKAALQADHSQGYAYADENGRTMVPLRALAEAMNLAVGWDGATGTITIQGGMKGTVTFRVESSSYQVNGAAMEMDTTPVVIEARTHVPVRFVVESLGGTVEAYPMTATSGLAVIVYYNATDVTPQAPAWAGNDYMIFPATNAYLPENWKEILDLRKRAMAGEDITQKVLALHNRFGAVNFRYDAGIAYECQLIRAECAAKGSWTSSSYFSWPGGYTPENNAARLSFQCWQARGLAAGATSVGGALSQCMSAMVCGGSRQIPMPWSSRAAWLEGFDRTTFYRESWFDGVRRDNTFQIDSGPQVRYDGYSILPYFSPYKIGDTLMVDLPTLCYGLGWTYQQQGQMLVITRMVPEKMEVLIPMGSATATMNGTAVSMGRSAEVKRVGDHSFAAVPITLVTQVLGQTMDYDEANDTYFINRAEHWDDSNMKGWLLGMCALDAAPFTEDPYLVGLHARFISEKYDQSTKKTEEKSETERLRDDLREDWGCTGAEDIRAKVQELMNAGAKSAHPAWEMFQAAQLISRGYGAEYLTLVEAVELAHPAAEAVQARYTGWDAACADYIAGYCITPGATEYQKKRLPEEYQMLKTKQQYLGTLFHENLFQQPVIGI